MRPLIEIQLDALFHLRADGRLVSTRDAPPRPAPWAFLGRSAQRHVWAVREDVDLAIAAELEGIVASEPPWAPEVRRTPACRARVLALLGGVSHEHSGPAYVLGEDLPHDARAREITLREAAECGEAFPWLPGEFDSVAPVAVAFEAGEPAAVCHSPRGLTRAAAEAGVETLERFRGRGLATAAVACWARAVQRAGRLALYSTSWENAASQGVARRLSARLYGEDWHVT